MAGTGSGQNRGTKSGKCAGLAHGGGKVEGREALPSLPTGARGDPHLWLALPRHPLQPDEGPEAQSSRGQRWEVGWELGPPAKAAEDL